MPTTSKGINVWVLAECLNKTVKPLPLIFNLGSLYHADGTPAITYDDGRPVYFSEEAAWRSIGGM